MVFNGMGPPNALFKRSMEGAAQVIGWITSQCARDRVRRGSIGAAIYDSADRAGVAEGDTALLIRSFLSAGVDTTVSGLSFVLYRLAVNPDQWRLLRDSPELARGAFEEAVRIDSPVVGFFRTTTTAVLVGPSVIEAGQKVLCSSPAPTETRGAGPTLTGSTSSARPLVIWASALGPMCAWGWPSRGWKPRQSSKPWRRR
jgi:cytochrome P450